MCSLNQAELGMTTFFASSYPSESCGSNGLPLTPNSVKILGRGQKLKSIIHPHLCKYIKIARGKYERLIIISEYYRDNLALMAKCGRFEDLKEIVLIAYQTLQGLATINKYGLVHRALSPQNINLDLKGNVKINKFGLFYITDHGNDVAFPIGVPKYLAPEVLASGPSVHTTSYATEYHFNKACPLSGCKADVWSLGIIITELALGIDLWANFSLEEVFRSILKFILTGKSESVLEQIALSHDASAKLQEIPLELRSFLETCLSISPRQRPTPKELLHHQLFLGFQKTKIENNGILPFVQFTDFPSVQLRCKNLELPQNGVLKDLEENEDYLSQRSMEEVLYLWKLAGGDVNAELKKQGLAKSRPPICTLPNIVLEDGEQFGLEKDRIYLLNETVVILYLDQLRQRLSSIEPTAFFPLLEDGSRYKSLPVTVSSTDLSEAASLPLIIRETDIEYQLIRMLLYERLLKGYPYKKQLIWKEARVDTPPLYRPLVWAALLEIEGDVQAMYDAIDKETPTSTDRQIEVDIPRCHQYDELLSSPEGHTKFKRLLKAWVISHPQYVYWQGLDSLCAPFLYLNFNNEALAYACLAAFIPKYLHKFFLKDNSPVIQEYLAVFSHLIAFHDPVLANHLDNIGFIPELYSIPWFLTMYTHVFPLHKIFHLWDTLLLGNSSFPLFIGVAILQQLKESLLSFGFNECILLFSDMPEIDIEKCVRDSIKIYCCTPKSATYRQHARHPGQTLNEKNTSVYLQDYNDKPSTELTMSPLPLEQLKSEVSPRISAEDLLELCELNTFIQSETVIKQKRPPKPKILIIDIRANEEFIRGAIPDSVNIPFKTAFSGENLASSVETKLVHAHKGRLIVVVGPGTSAATFATKLVRLGYPRVCVLHRGIDVLKLTGILVIPPAEL